MAIKILILAVIVVVVFVLYVATRPADFSIVRSLAMSAPASAVFARVNEFAKWRDWSPLEGLDPNLNRTYDGPPAGVGSHYGWAGNNKVGEGSMLIERSEPDRLIAIRLEFLRPFRASNEAVFTFAPQTDGTLVTWQMTGTSNFMSKLFRTFVDMDKLVGGDFEKGLANLKSLVEAK